MPSSEEPPNFPSPPTESVLTTLSESLVEVCCVVDQTGRVVETIGQPSRDTPIVDADVLEGQTVDSAFGSGLEQRLAEGLADVYDSRSKQTFDVPVDGPDGKQWFEVCIAPIDRDTTADHAMALVRDVSESRREFERLQRAQRALSNVFDASEDLFFIADSEGRLVDSNEALARLTGSNEQRLQGTTLTSLVSPADRQRLAAFLESVRRNGCDRTTCELRSADGSLVAFELVGGSFERISGDPGCVVIGRNVTERRRQERAVARHLDRVLDAIDDLVYIYGPDGRLRHWNRSLNLVTGYTDEEIRKMTPPDFFPEAEHERIAHIFAEVFETGSGRIEISLVTKHGEKIPYQFAANTIQQPDGETVLCGIGREITDRIEREEQIAVLSRALRHNVRNKMTVVSGEAEYLKESIIGDLSAGIDRAELAVEDVRSNLERVERAAADLIALSENSFDITRLLLAHQEPEPTDIEDDLEHVVAEGHTTYPDAEIALTTDGDLTTQAIPEIGRAVWELIENACEHTDAPTVTVTAEQRDDEIRLEVRDDGPGLPPNEANVITRAEPMTPVFHGSGMGLWVARWIVTLSRGTIAYRTPEAGGAVFEIRLTRPL